MCIASPKVVAAPTVAPAPTRAGVAASLDPVSLVNQTKSLISRRQGVFGNIRTTPLGDSSYGSAAVARFG